MGWRELWGSGLGRARSSRPFCVPTLEQSSGTQNGRELLALTRQESQSSHQQLEPKMALNSWVDVSFGVPVLEEQRVHGRFGFQLWKDCRQRIALGPFWNHFGANLGA